MFKMKATSGSGGDFPTCPAGTHPAVLVGLLDLGTHTEEFQGQSKDTRKVLLVWEVDTDSGLFVVCRDYTLSFNEKAALRQVIEKWRGKAFGLDEEFDLTAIVGKPCMLSIVHKQSQKGNTYARVDGVMQLPRGMQPVVPTNKPVTWSVGEGTPFPTRDWLPYLRGQPLADYVKGCKEWQGGSDEAAPAGVGSSNEDSEAF